MSEHVAAPRPHRGRHERGYLPHFDSGAAVQTITFRLADSLPRAYYEKLDGLAANATERSILIEKGIDAGWGTCLLRDPVNAALVYETLERFDGERYRLLAWVIMPNHVHAMIEQVSGHSLTGVVHSWKSFTAMRSTRRAVRPDEFGPPIISTVSFATRHITLMRSFISNTIPQKRGS